MSRLSVIVHYFSMQKGMRMKELAERIGITPATLSQNLAKDNPKPSTFRKLEDALDLGQGYLEGIYNDDDLYNKIASRQIIRYETLRGSSDDTVDIQEVEGNEPNPIGGNLLTKTPLNYFSLSEPNRIFALINFKGTKLKANSLQDIKDIANILSALEAMPDKEQYDSTLSLLVKQYGHNQ